jgi:hypothetical protein
MLPGQVTSGCVMPDKRKNRFQYMSSDKYMFMLDDVNITTSEHLVLMKSAKNKHCNLPNPTKGEITIKTDNKIKSVSVIDLSGKMLNKRNPQPQIFIPSKRSLSDESRISDGTSATEKVIKQ